MKKFKEIQSNDDLIYNLNKIYSIYQAPMPNDLFDDENLLYELFEKFDETKHIDNFYIFLNFIGNLKEDGVYFTNVKEFLENRENQYKDIYQKSDVLVKLEEKIANQIKGKK